MRPVMALLRHRLALAVVLNLLVATLAYVLAFALRFDFSIPPPYLRVLGVTLPLLLVSKVVGFSAFRLFSGWWQHVTLCDLADIARGNVLASGLFLVLVVFSGAVEGFPRSIFLLDLLVCTGMMAGGRAAIRLVRELDERSHLRRVDTLVLIVGAGSAGIHLLQEIESRPHLRLGVVGFADDDAGKTGLRIAGKRVLGRVDDVPGLVARHDVGEVLIAMPSAPSAVLRHVVQRCREAGVRHRVLPTLSELVEGRVMYTQMRDVKLDDLLARQPVRLDVPGLRAFISGKRVLVTGAAGSIGSELCRQVAAYRPEQLILYDRHENGMYALEQELRARFGAASLTPVLGDVLLEDQLRSVFALRRPDTVFHAAAYKHLPMAEFNVIEAVRNNVVGTHNVARAALEHGTREFVLVSTDKAVRPTSVMGVTKRLAEMVIQRPPGAGPRFVAVRFGNVLGSNGSVVPLFRDQIARGGPVTVTDADVTRYFMTIPEAVQLILQAAAIGQHGDVLILEMGEPVRILDLARHMIRLSGYEPHDDIEIVFTGLRPGEKLHEELVAEDEEVGATPHDRIRVLRPNGGPYPPEGWISTLQAHVETGDVPATIAFIRSLVPCYRPSDVVAAHAEAGGGPDGSRPPSLAQVA
ncbi:MAG TPA: nucleoside-diphosphate sugar epimerase/dehydratase [Methylomirabilota bacterium]